MEDAEAPLSREDSLTTVREVKFDQDGVFVPHDVLHLLESRVVTTRQHAQGERRGTS